MTFRTFALEKTIVRAATGPAQGAVAELGDLPSWRLEDLYPSATSDAFRSDMKKAEADSIAFEAKWKGKLATAATKAGDEGIGAAVKEFEALEDIMGRIASLPA